MFDVELVAALAKVALKVEQHDGIVIRRMHLSLDRELDDELAHGLGRGAKKARALLLDHSVEKCTIGLGTVEAKGVFACGSDRVELGSLRGVLATCKAGDDGEVPPGVRLEFEAPYNDDAWAFLGRNCGAYVHITLTRRQLELAGAA